MLDGGKVERDMIKNDNISWSSTYSKNMVENRLKFFEYVEKNM